MRHGKPNNKTRHTWGRSHIRLYCGLLWIVGLLFLSGHATQAQISREYQLKAVFLFNFAQFTDWPTNAFADPKSPIVIGIVGPDPFGAALEDTIRGENVGGRPLRVEHFARPADIKTCHMLFISQPDIRYTEEILNALKGNPVLTVSDAESPATSEIMIRFLVENNKVHFRINPQAARAVNITLSSRLLRVAEVAPGGRTGP
jgi:hypothetical protein